MDQNLHFAAQQDNFNMLCQEYLQAKKDCNLFELAAVVQKCNNYKASVQGEFPLWVGLFSRLAYCADKQFHQVLQENNKVFLDMREEESLEDLLA